MKEPLEPATTICLTLLSSFKCFCTCRPEITEQVADPFLTPFSTWVDPSFADKSGKELYFAESSQSTTQTRLHHSSGMCEDANPFSRAGRYEGKSARKITL